MLSKTLLQIVKFYGIHYVLTTILTLFGTYFTRQLLYKNLCACDEDILIIWTKKSERRPSRSHPQNLQT